MGLDVYLTRYEDKAAYDAWEAEADSAKSAICDRYRTGDTCDYDAAQPEIKAYDAAHPAPARVSIELDSARHPEHMFKIGYARSSYNEGGINSLLRALLGEGRDLYYVFCRKDDDAYESNATDWERVKVRAREVRGALEYAAESVGGCSVMKMTYGLGGNGPARSAADALRLWREELAKGPLGDRPGGFNCYGNAAGTFCMGREPMRVRAVILGSEPSLWAKLKGQGDQFEPVTYLVVEGDDGYRWQIQALEVVEEWADHMLAMPRDERAKHWLRWSS